MNKIKLMFVCSAFAGCFAGINATFFSLLLPQILPDLMRVHDQGSLSQMGSYILFAFLMGWMMGGMFLGVISDRLGRITALAISIYLSALSMALIAIVMEPWQLLICRFFTGLGVGGTMVCVSVLLCENYPKKAQALVIGAVITSFQAGVFITGFVAQYCENWRLLFAFSGCPFLLGVLIQFLIKEKSKPTLKPLSLHFKGVFEKEHRLCLVVGSLLFGGLLVGYWASLAWVPTWIADLLGAATRGDEKNHATMLHGISAVGGCIFASHLIKLIGKRGVVLLSFLGAFVTSMWMFLTNERFTFHIYWEYSLLGFWIGMAQTVMYIYLPELFPPEMRATSVGFCLNIGRVATAILVLFVGILVTLIGGYVATLSLFSCMYLMGFFAFFQKKREVFQSSGKKQERGA